MFLFAQVVLIKLWNIPLLMEKICQKFGEANILKWQLVTRASSDFVRFDLKGQRGHPSQLHMRILMNI